jgi:hypothetical protein
MEERFTLAHGFRDFSFRPWLLAPMDFTSVTRQKHHGAENWWLIPVILATQEAQMRRITV